MGAHIAEPLNFAAREVKRAQLAALLRSVGKQVRCIHERVHGTGYPDRLTADQIPLDARNVADGNADTR